MRKKLSTCSSPARHLLVTCSSTHAAIPSLHYRLKAMPEPIYPQTHSTQEGSITSPLPTFQIPDPHRRHRRRQTIPTKSTYPHSLSPPLPAPFSHPSPLYPPNHHIAARPLIHHPLTLTIPIVPLSILIPRKPIQSSMSTSIHIFIPPVPSPSPPSTLECISSRTPLSFTPH